MYSKRWIQCNSSGFNLCQKYVFPLFASSFFILHTQTNTPHTITDSLSGLTLHGVRTVQCTFIHEYLDSITLLWLFFSSSSMAIKAFIEVEKKRWINSVKYSFISRFFGHFIRPSATRSTKEKWCNWPHTLGKKVRTKHQHDVRDVILHFCLYVRLMEQYFIVDSKGPLPQRRQR